MRRLVLPNGRQIIDVYRAELSNLIREQIKVSVMLANVDDNFDDDFVESLVSLYDVGCRNFMCCGIYSEQLHDEIDSKLLAREDAESAVTTFHGDDETIDDVVAVFWDIAGSQASGSPIFVDMQSIRDAEILSKLIRGENDLA